MMTQFLSNPPTENEIAAQWAVFGPTPVLPTEDQYAYDRIRASYVAHFEPTNPLQMRLIREVVDADWEISRMTRNKAVAVERRFCRQIENQVTVARVKIEERKQRIKRLQASGTPADLMEVDRLNALIETTLSDVQELLKRKPREQDNSLALEKSADFINNLDKWHVSATARRNNALQLLEYYKPRRNRPSEIIEAEYKEIEDKRAAEVTVPVAKEASQ
jgi:hypothetical protein